MCATFLKWNLGLIQLDDENVEPIPDLSGAEGQLSISRCSKGNYPMQQECWESSKPTPKKINECSIKVDPLYTFKHGRSLQTSAQYIIMNVRNFFNAYKQGNAESLLEGNAAEVTSKATGVSARSINNINTRHQLGTIQTPNKRKRKRINRAMIRFTEADKEFIINNIQKKYEDNRPPFLNGVYKDTEEHFMKGRRVMCGKNTFRKILYMMGFHYGKIDALSVVLQRPDIVAKRAVYLRKMRDNDLLENPKPVIYTGNNAIF